jgi:hypothetical protein
MVSRPELLVETLVMAGLYAPWDAEVAREVNGYKLDTRGSSPVAHYAYGLVALVEHAGQQTEPHVMQLARVKKNEWLSSIGRTIEAITKRDQEGFDAALTGLLEAHKRMAKFGAIRESPEGFLSLAGMSLSKLALDRALTVEVESEYLSMGYLRYLKALA